MLFPVNLLLVVLVAAQVLIAQYNLASLGGTVSDPTGAAVPDARVTVRNTGTGLTRNTTTGATGAFVLPSLPVGAYHLTIEKQGFSRFVQDGIALTVNQAGNVTVTLQLGQVAEEVTVSAGAELVTTREATVGQLVDARRVVDLPLDGRRAQVLVFLSAGTANLTSRYCGFNCYGGVYPGEQRAAVNGGGAGAVYYTLDGSGHNDTYIAMNLPFPNPDAVQEFKLQENNISALHGSSGSGVVNIVTKSGTNELHGTVFHFLRNGALNARNFFAPVHDTLKRNQFGGSLGGPIAKDRLFFFTSYQGTRISSAPAGLVAFVPTQAERNGNFTGSPQLIDPRNNTPFPGNQIPRSRFSQPSIYFMNRLALPNGPGRQLTFSRAPSYPYEDEGTVKIDYVRGLHHISGRYFNTDFRQPPVPTPADNVAAADTNGNRVRVQSISGDYTYTVSPTFLIEGNFGYNRQRGGSLSSATFSFADAGAKITPGPKTPPGEIVLSVGGGFSVNTNHPGDFNRDDFTYRGMASLIRGEHQIRFGMEAARVQNQIDNTFTQFGQVTFNGRLSGDNIADFLLGDMSQFRQGGGEFKDLVGWRWGWFAQDDWRVNDRLTLNVGIRWDPYIPYHDRGGRFACFQPGVKSTRYPNAPVGLTFAAGAGQQNDAGCPPSGIYNHWNTVAPRIGFAYKLTGDGRSALRGGVGYYYNAVSTNAQTSHFNAPIAAVFQFNGIIDFADPYGSVGIANPFPANFGGLRIPGPDATFVLPTALQVTHQRVRPPLLTTWNLTLERQVGASWVVRGAYVGNKGTHIITQFQSGRELNAAIFGPGATVANIQARRPYQSFTTISSSQGGHNSHYHSIQLTVERQFSRGFSILANYTLAKTMDDHGWTNPFNRRFDYARSNDDLPHNFNFSGLWQVPKVSLSSSVADRILNGWQLGSIVSWRSGFPFSIRSGVDNAVSGVNRDRADFIGTDINAAQLGSGRPHSELITQFFDTSVWARNALGTFGNSGRNILQGPRAFTMNLSVLKGIPITERFHLQFRGEFFNSLNNVNFSAPGATLGTAAFGRITSAEDPRILQFGLKLMF